jgi:DNA modification methylase
MPARYTIHNADAFTWLEARPARTVHAVVTDPPYGVAEYLPAELVRKKQGKGLWRLPHAYDGYKRTSMPRFTVLRPVDHERIASFHGRLSPSLLRVLVPGGHVIMAAHSLVVHLIIDEFTKAGFEYRGQIARTVRTLRGGDRPKFAHKKYPNISVTPRSCWEPWLIFRRPCVGLVRDNLRRYGTGGLRRPSKDSPFLDLIPSGPVRGLERAIAPHPSVKPQAFMRQIVTAALPLGKGIILDPFMGSGSTIAAARSQGLYSVGVELNAGYFRLARKAIPLLAAAEVADLSKAPKS